MLVRVCGGGGAGRNAQLGEDVADVPINGPCAQHQLCGNLPVGEACGNKGEYLHLPSGQTARSRWPTASQLPGGVGVRSRTEATKYSQRLVALEGGRRVITELAASLGGTHPGHRHLVRSVER